MNQLTDLEKRMFTLIAAGDLFTADDVTDAGNVTLDPTHEANSRQNGVGALFRLHSVENHIRSTGRVVASRAPHRKGGMIREWQPTAAGRAYAHWRLEQQP